MKKKTASSVRLQASDPHLFAKTENRRRRSLFLARFLAEDARSNLLRGKKQDRAQEILRKWAELESGGHLDKKETALDASFLHEVFGDALGYQSVTQSPQSYQLERNYSVPGVGTADGALGLFGSELSSSSIAVIELKGAKIDLDRDKSTGRTAVQQCWDYLNALPDCPWGIVSNFTTTRLYHRDKTPLAYQEFRLQDMAQNEDVFRQFYCLLEMGGLLPSPLGEPRALQLLNRTAHRQREVGDELYSTYSDQRWRLIEHLHRQQGKSLDEAIRIAQILLDRIIFVAFCEDRGLLPEKCIETAYNTLPPFSKVTNPRWQNFLALFHAVDKGHSRDLGLENGYNGGLFRHDIAVDDLQLDDDWTHFFRTVDNLYGVDLSQQAVEISQLALWIRSARHGRTLADLSHNIVQGNSLVADRNVHPKALEWAAVFPTVFNRQGGGFDCVIGNPPWERLKLQEREFFAFVAPSIANAVSAARRRKLIAELESSNPELFARYTAAKDSADRILSHVRSSGDFPLTARGDINTYVLFTELARKLLAPSGRAGLLVPSGIATDNTTRDFFNALMESKSLIKLYDFDNRQRIFPDVDGRFKFCVLLFGGSEVKKTAADFVFFAHSMNDLKPKGRHISLSSADLALLNPNTHTCPIFRSRRDAELTKDIYRRVPILIDESRREGGNPWGIRFVRMFDQTNDAELFHDAAELKEMGCRHAGNRWMLGQRTFLPLYEAKMVQAYDHRAASVKLAEGNWVRQGQTEDTTLVEHQNPEFVVQPRWWVEEREVIRSLKVSNRPAFLSFKDITSPTNQRTMIAALVPWCAATNHLIIVMTESTPRLELCLLANMNSLVFDYATRQKIGGVTLNFFIVNQLPAFHPVEYAKKCPWDKRTTLESWIAERALKLSCTANDLKAFAASAGFDPPVHRWDAEERAELLAELDAAFFVLYGVGREDVEYILGTFAGLRSEESSLPGFRSTTARILEAYDRLRL